jgi:hypothetical protein
MPETTRTSSASVKFLTSGTYRMSDWSDPVLGFVADTEVEVPIVSTEVYASGTDEMYSFVRGKFWFTCTTTSSIAEWYLLKCLATDATQDLSNDTVVEGLQVDRRIFARGVFTTGIEGYSPFGVIKFAKYNVKLRDGEELRLLVRPIKAGAVTIKAYGILEWRKVGE